MSSRRIKLLAMVAFCLLEATGVIAQNTVFKGKKLLLVAATSSPTAPIDANIKKHFESLGMAVTMVPDVNVPPATGYDLVFLASDVKAKTITYAYRDTTVPIFSTKPWMLDFLGMAGYEPQKDYGEETKEEQSFLWFVNAPHPIQSGFPNGMFMPVKHAIKTYNWGLPEPAAQVIAYLPGEPTKAVVFAYEKGVSTQGGGFTMPARRVFYGIAPDGFDDLIPDGMKLFDACAAWALSGK